jgi:hypothetical protein
MTTNQNVSEELWDVFIYEIETRKIVSVPGVNMRESGGFHTVNKRLDTVAPRLNDRYDLMAVPAGKFKRGDVLPEDVEKL